MGAPGTTGGPWSVCRHLKSVEHDAACGCGYRGVIYGPEHDVCFAICQPGHEPAPEGQEGTEPSRYPRAVEIANSHQMAASPAMYDALEALLRRFEPLSTADRDAQKTARAALAQARGEPS
jgi:hypothetical protein